ncbi:MAG TPA: protease pro-enzyme activation domain-containing protein, partial [Terracidiphilus sp.]
MATPTSYRPIPGSERPQLPNSQEVGILDAAERVTVTVLLRQKPGSPEVPDLQYWQDTLPNKREYLSEKEFLETYGEAEEDAQVVINYLKSMGLG